jgi:hypothetical protein
VTEAGRTFLRRIGLAFDRYLVQAAAMPRLAAT